MGSNTAWPLLKWNPLKETRRPITLTPETLSKEIQCLRIVENFLPPELADNILTEMVDMATTWEVPKWVIFDKGMARILV